MNYKIFTMGLFLFLLLEMGLNVKAQSPASGDYVFTGAKDSAWATLDNWGISDGAGGTTAATALPTASNNVWIPAGDTLLATATSTSKSASWTSGSNSITLSSTNSSIAVGMYVMGIGIPSGTTVTEISTDGLTLTLSQNTTSAPTSSSTTNLYFTSTVCNNLYVAGKFTNTTAVNVLGNVNIYGTEGKITVLQSQPFYVQGDVTINKSDTLYIGNKNSSGSTVYFYCANIYNSGVINAASDIGGTKTYLYIGYNGANPGSDDYVIENDGVFGTDAISCTSPITKGSGIKLLYSELAKSLTIKPSSSTVTGYAFNIGSILPNYSSSTSPESTQAFTLNLNEDMSLLYNSDIALSLQNGNLTSATRTLNIPVGITVYCGGAFHAKRAVAGTVAQGDFVYNVYGTLDLSTNIYYNAGYPTDFDLCMTTYSGNTGKITFNLGDGTNPATLVIGKATKIIKQTTQSVDFNFNTNSTVKFASSTIKNNGGANIFQLQNINPTTGCYNPAVSVFPKDFYNLTIDNDSTVLPVAATYKGSFNKSSNCYSTTTWSASTSYSAPTANTTMNQGAVINTGTYCYYVPFVYVAGSYESGSNSITVAADTIAKYIYTGQTVTSSVSGIPSSTTVSSYTSGATTFTSSNLTTAAASSALLYFAKGTSSSISAPTPTTTFTDIATATYNPVLDGSQYLIYLGKTSDLLPATSGINSATSNDDIKVYANDNQLVILNANEGDVISVYTITGAQQTSAVVNSSDMTFTLPSGLYLVKVGSKVTKVFIK